ncbi:MAG: hypothetical protein V4685_10405 [Bacteroidota bacterium]
MKKLLCLITITVVLFSACKSKTEKETTEKEVYEKAKESLEEREKKNPVDFIKATGHDKHNLIGRTVVRGTIMNSAKICAYKDFELEFSFFSKTGVLLQKELATVYDIIPAGKSVDFKEKMWVNKDADSMAIKVLKAKVN